MALMDENGMYGAIGELAVAQQLVWQRCAVNSITQMDYGTDLTVQLPVMPCTPEVRTDRKGRPMPHNKVWPLSTHHVHVQVKSSRQRKPTTKIPRDLVRSWLPTGRNVPPTFLILIDVSGPAHSDEKMDDAPRFLFTPADFLDQVARNPDASISFEGSEDTLIGQDDDLLRRIHAWTEHSHIVGALLDEGVHLPARGRPDPDEAWQFAALLVRSWLYRYTTPSGELSAVQGDEVKSKLLSTMSDLGYAQFGGGSKDALRFEKRADEVMVEIMSDSYSSQQWPEPPLNLSLLSRQNIKDHVWTDIEGFARMWGEPLRALRPS